MSLKTGAGWVVERPDSKNLTTVRHKGDTFVVKRGSGGNISRAMLWAIVEADKIELRSEAGWDGTYNYRPVRGSSSVWSEHAAGVAYDHNASQHMRGGDRYQGFNYHQILDFRGMLATSRGKAFRWGADFTTTKDAMHFELRSPSVWLTKRRLFSKSAMLRWFKANGITPF